MIAAGIDLGGTKIEAQLFDADWNRGKTKRVATPATYDALVEAVVDLIQWAGPVPVGISAAGLINPQTGIALTANLPASGKPFPADVTKRAGRKVTWVNDARSVILSEAVFGAAKDVPSVAGLILGTGVGGGIAVKGRLLAGPTGTVGEIGHGPLSAPTVAKYGLPIHACGCGRKGCVETYVSGPGMVRIAEALGSDLRDTRLIAAERGQVWRVWCELTAELLLTLSLAADPEVVVIAGGLSNIPHLIEDLTAALKVAQFGGFGIPELRLATVGDTAGASGAAYAAWRKANHG